MSSKSNLGARSPPSPGRPPKPTPSAAAPERDASDSDAEETFHDAHFPPDEEASLLAASNTTRAEANTLFAQARYSEAISTYDRALGSCPNYLDYEIAVLKSNIAACHLKLEEWKQAVEAANTALEALDRIDPPPPTKKEKETKKTTTEEDDTATDRENDVVVELEDGEDGEDDGDDTAALAKLALSDARKADISRIRAKALMRRARARASLSGWANLSGAEEDYKLLASDARLSSILPPSDMKIVRAGLRDLPPKIAAAKDNEMAEMMGKLKELGNGILKPFGLSTDNFKMVKDETTGGYSMSFEQGGKK